MLYCPHEPVRHYPTGMTQSQQGSTSSDDRSVWSLNRDEQRLLWITFAGGLGSILAGALIVGGAVALLRVIGEPGPLAVLVLAVGTFIGIAVSAFLLAMRRLPSFPGAFGRTMERWTLVSVFAGLSWLALLWIGIAAGVK